MNNTKSGKYSEFLARMFFRLKGYSIIAQNHQTGKGTHAGEIDFVAKKGKTIVFVEVKKRRDLDKAAYAISQNQKQRIINGAKAFLQRNSQYINYDSRFDAVLVQLPLSIKHIKDAWRI